MPINENDLVPMNPGTLVDKDPARSVSDLACFLLILGDLWSYNADEDAFIVSPEPDTYVWPIDITKNRCLILGTDGCWNMLNAQQVCKIIFS